MFSFNRVLLLQTVPSTCEKKIDLLMEREKDRFGAEDFKQGDYSPSLSLSLLPRSSSFPLDRFTCIQDRPYTLRKPTRDLIRC